MEQNLYSALICFLNDAGLLKTLHDRARSIRLQDGGLNFGTKGVKVPTIEETTVVLQKALISEKGSHIQWLETLSSALDSLSMGIPAFLGEVSGVVQELVKDLFYFTTQYLRFIISRI